jgi:hypothetical protein
MCLTLDSYPVVCQGCNFEKMCRSVKLNQLTRKLHKKTCPHTGRTERSELTKQVERERDDFTFKEPSHQTTFVGMTEVDGTPCVKTTKTKIKGKKTRIRAVGVRA